jgi:MFS family permease
MVLFALASAIMAQHSNDVPLAITGCLVLGLALGGMNVLMACIAARLFDSMIFGVVYGTLTSMSVIAAAIGPLVVSKIHDVSHSYAPAFWTGAGIAIVVALLLTRLKPVGNAGPATD